MKAENTSLKMEMYCSSNSTSKFGGRVQDSSNKYEILRSKFGYSSFRAGQEEAIDAILAGADVLAVMPTGAGKSLCYQIPALLLDGMTIVVSPLISLMKDQVTALREAGCEAAFLNSSLNASEYHDTMDKLMSGSIKLLYVAPERLQKLELPQFTSQTGVKLPLVVIDEAHCVSQWGHDFRTSYLDIAGFVKKIKPRPVVAAFTATATPKVKENIRELLSLRNAVAVNTGFDRSNLYFEVQRPAAKKTALLDCLFKRKNSSGIIYCSTRKTVEETCELLARNGFDVTRYHAGLDDNERRKNQEDFIYDRKTIMVATNAFGMGIDKSNVSFVIHYNMPKNIESYYQEAGRAGRDGEPADCILLYNGQDVRINQFLITKDDDDDDYDINDDDDFHKQRLKEHNLELLRHITFYSTSDDCLRRRLLTYFGESSAANCGNCSNCLAEHEEIDITTEAKKIVSCVYRLKERNRSFGKTMIIDILRGSKNEKVRRFGFDTLSTWGIMTETSAHRIRLIIDYLIAKGYLILEDGEYPIVLLGNANALLKGEAQVFMKLPEEQKSAPKTETATAKPQILSAVDEALFDKLRKLRNEIAAKESVPAYLIFSNATLTDMCRRKPTSLAEFSAVSGVGQVKLEKYGETFVKAIREHCS